MKISLLILLLFLLTGCEYKNNKKENTTPVNSISNEQKEIKIYNAFFENENYTLKKFEPKKGIYNGFFIDEGEKDFINKFEQKNNINHTIYMKDIKLDDEYPLSFVLSCFSNNKTPFITILPPDDIMKTFDRELLIKMAKDFGNLDIPIFINFYPVTKQFEKNSKEYKEFFKLAKTYFDIYAKNTCFVWTINHNFAYVSKNFYPGNEYTDWVGINITEDISNYNELEFIFNELDTFYKTYEVIKPIAISSLKISHFSNKTLKYNIETKIKELERFYKELPLKYPRIKMINYFNYDTFNQKEIENKQNYLLTENKEILKAYKSFIEEGNFLINIITTNYKNQSSEKIKLPFLIYMQEDKFFLSKDAIEKLGYENIIKNLKKYYINSYILFDLEEFKNLTNFNINIDNKNKNIIIK